MSHKPTTGVSCPNSTTTQAPDVRLALAILDNALDAVRQAIAPAVAGRVGDSPMIWLGQHLAVAAYEVQEARHVAELLTDTQEGGRHD